MVFYCSLCCSEERWVYSGFCSECEKLKDLIKIYSVENINDIVKKVLIVDKFYPIQPQKIIRDEADLIEKPADSEEDFNKKVSDEIDNINNKYSLRIKKTTKSV
jgi:hypothetical protein